MPRPTGFDLKQVFLGANENLGITMHSSSYSAPLVTRRVNCTVHRISKTPKLYIHVHPRVNDNNAKHIGVKVTEDRVPVRQQLFTTKGLQSISWFEPGNLHASRAKIQYVSLCGGLLRRSPPLTDCPVCSVPSTLNRFSFLL